MYENVLVPTDGSEGAEVAIEEALDIATMYEAAVHVVFVADTTSLPSEIDQGVLPSEIEETGRDIIDDVIERAEEMGLTARGEVLGGAAHEAIVDYADGHGIDLGVMGTHGRTGLRHYLIGSVTERVVRLADASVLAVKRPGTTPSR